MKVFFVSTALLLMFILGNQAGAETSDRYRDSSATDIGISNFLFLRGNWTAVDSSKTNLIESWTESSDGLFGLRRFSPKFGSAEYDLISFQAGIRNGIILKMVRLDESLRPLGQTALTGKWSSPLTNKGNISFQDDDGNFHITMDYDSPQDDLLTVRIVTTEGKNSETHVFQLKRAK